jgi:hypothetical protein
MGEAFEPAKDWKLSFEFMAPKSNSQGVILFWGDKSETILALRLATAALDLVATTNEGEAVSVRASLPPEKAGRWVSCQVNCDAAQELALVVDGKLARKVQLPAPLRSDHDFPVRIGRGGDRDEPFGGKVKDIWLGNALAPSAVKRPADPPRAKKLSIPEEDALLAATKELKAMLKEEFAEKDPAKKPRLIAQLFRQAQESPNAALRFASLREIRDLAAQAVDLPLAWQAVEQLDQIFADKPIEHYVQIMEAAKKASRTRQKDEELFIGYLRVLDEIKQADAFDQLNNVTPIGQAFSVRLSKELKAVLDRSLKTLAQVAKEHERVKEFRERLKENPQDTMAAAEVGRYVAFFKEDWAKGLELLAGATGMLARTAKKDLAQPCEPLAQLQLADDWEEIARAETGLARNHIQDRAKLWYYRSLSRLEGMTRTRVEDRLKFKFPPGYLKPGLLVEYLEGKTVLKRGLEYSSLKLDPASLTPDPLVKGTTVRWRGVVSVPQVRHYVCVVKGVGQTKVSLDKKLVFDSSRSESQNSRPVLVIDGFNPIQVDYRCPDAGPQFELHLQPVGIGIEPRTPLTFYHRPEK